MRSKLAIGALVAVVALVWVSPAVATGRSLELDFRGQAIVPTGTMFEGTTVGGLSSITYDKRRGVYYALSDDPSQFQPARFYTVAVDVRDGHLNDGDVSFRRVTTLLNNTMLRSPPWKRCTVPKVKPRSEPRFAESRS